MLILISLLLVLPFAILGKDFIKKHSIALYIVSALVSAGTVYILLNKIMLDFPDFVRKNIFNLFANGAIASAMFIVVMFIGALSRESSLRKKLMPIRAELSIMASILTLGHNIAFGVSYFTFLFVSPERLPLNQLLASIVSLIMILIMLPLFVTSFYSIRKKMKGSSWKNLQKLAYIFYALMYVHVLLLAVPYALKGRSGYTLMVAIYSMIFCIYFAMRVSKAMASSSKGVKTGLWTLASVVCIFAIALSMPNVIVKVKDDNSEVAMANKENATVISTEGEAVVEKTQIEEKPVEEAERDLSTTPNGSARDDKNTPDDSAQDDAKDAVISTEGEAVVEKSQTEKKSVEEAERDLSTTPGGSARDDKNTPNGSAQDDGGKDAQEDNVQAEPEPVQEPQPEPVQEPQPEPEPEPQPEPEPEPESDKEFNDGTYTGYGKGYVANVAVTITIQDDFIVSVNVSGQEDEPYWTDCLNVMPNRIMAAQSGNVQGVSGATVSANAIINGAKAAINSARR